MGLHLSQVYLRGFDVDRLFKRVGSLWSDGIRADRENGHRQLIILLAKPWAILLDSTNTLPAQLALTLSGEAGGQSVWVSVGSNTLSYTLLRAAEGETVEDRHCPDFKADDLMPWYVDAEQEAWDALARLGIPAEYRLLRPRDVDNDEPSPGKADMIVLERPALDKPLQHVYLKHTIRSPRTHEQGPPTEYSVFHEPTKKLYDEYILHGVLEEARVDHLLGVLDGIARRKLRPPEFTYRPIFIAGTGDKDESEAAREFLKARYAELSKTRTFAFQI
jgi:hypothetical protein